MKDWLKKQTLEITAWTGLALVVGAFFFPRGVFLILGIVLIAIDDEKAAAWVKKIAPWAQRKIDAA